MLTNGKKLDNRYIVHKEIGSGGFGAVYLAEDTRFGGDNKVAIKKMSNLNEVAEKSFRQEADLLYNLSHPNLPKVTNCFQENDASFIVMDYITGEDLSVKLKRGKKFSNEEVLLIADKVLNALEYLHSFLIFHRDIKPHNIKIDENGKIFLLDFGTAKGSFDETTLTKDLGQSVTGYTPFYAPLEQMLRVDANSFLLLQSTDSPHLEQFLDRKTDARSDIYSLGATLYHLLTGYSPEQATATVRAHAIWTGKKEPLPNCQTLNPQISDKFAHIIKRCMEILPKDRFQTATELRNALNSAEGETLPIIAEDLPIIQPSNLEIPIEQPARTQPIYPVENDIQEESVAGSISSLFDKETLEGNQRKSKTMPIVLAGIGALCLLIMLGLGGWFFVKPLLEEVVQSEQAEKEIGDIAKSPSDAKPDNSTIPKTEDSHSLDYSLLVQKMRNGNNFQEPFESSGQEVFENGYQFQMHFSPSESGYLYVFNEGLNDKGEKIYNIIFPTPVRNNGIAEVSSKEKYESGWNEFGGTAGTENFWIIWSKKSNELLENSRKNAFDSDTGELDDKDLKNNLKEFLEEKSKSENEISKNFEEQYSQIEFKGDSGAHLIKLEHR